MASSSSLDQHEHAQPPSANGTDINEVLQDPSSNGNDIGLQDPFVTDIINIFSSNHDFEIPPVCVFYVPKFLSNSKPEAYSPKVIGLGPLHHSESPLQMRQVGVARNIHDEFRHIKFQELIQGLVKLGPYIRACYQMYLTDKDEKIACTMAIDGLFLFALLCHCNRGKVALTSSDTLLRLLTHTDMSRFPRDEILGDTIMLQNQIPIFVLKQILLMECSESLIVEKNLPRLLLGYCKALSPFKVMENYPYSMALKRTHMLDLLYHLITLTEPELEKLIDEEGRDKKERKKADDQKKEEKKSDNYVAYRPQLGPTGVLDFLSGLPLPKELKKSIELVKGLVGLPWSLLLYLSFIGNKAGVGDQEEYYLMPTASQLSDVGVKFSRDHIRDIRFKRETASIMLPVLKVNVNSEVTIRNLLAYEVMMFKAAGFRYSAFKEYIKLMSALVKTAKDVKVLRDHNILEYTGRYMKDDEVAKIFNGMTEPLSTAKEPAYLDWDMRGINDYYNGLQKVKVRKLVKQILKLFVTILLWLFVALYLFGSVYGYPLVFEKSKSFCGSVILVLSKLLSFSSTRITSSQLLSSGRPPLTLPT
ncbi:hypothetical protein F2P56_011192 [Juglans regia]|uniref:Uncharacterized protein n=3 Tax=Juglans regia TaxID=51240 RepID=A0A834CXJ2_JUGRE|nr:putative UPF0481 protein At3g02645 isoform X2 [Juglans regia]KAF5470695.1 hypothetical protein F2P56_011192 [Juglans regia]